MFWFILGAAAGIAGTLLFQKYVLGMFNKVKDAVDAAVGAAKDEFKK